MSDEAFEKQRRAAKHVHFDDVRAEPSNKRSDFDAGFASGWNAATAEKDNQIADLTAALRNENTLLKLHQVSSDRREIHLEELAWKLQQKVAQLERVDDLTTTTSPTKETHLEMFVK